MSISHQQLKGVLITGLGVVFLAPDALIIRLVSADLRTLFFWRSLFMSVGMALVAVFMHVRSAAAVFSRLGRTGWLSVLLYAINNLFFVIAVSNTTAANVLAIIGLTPLFAALLGLIFIGEWVPRRTWFAIVVCLAGNVSQPNAHMADFGRNTRTAYGHRRQCAVVHLADSFPNRNQE